MVNEDIREEWKDDAEDFWDRCRRHDPVKALARMESMFAHLRLHFVSRDAVLEQIFYALLTREHVLIMGDRGLAKSRLARSVFAHFSDDRAPFSLQLTRSTSVGQLVGGLDLVAFERGNYFHNLEGYIVKAHFAFLDELFDANDFVLRALNGILNEREFLNGPQVEKAALHSAIATTNYVRDTRESRAVLDRLLFKCIVKRAESTVQRFRIRKEFISSHGGTIAAEPGRAMAYDELLFLSEIVHGENPTYKVSVPAHVLVMLDDIISSFERDVNEGGDPEEFSFSDRTKNKAIHVLIASALRAGRKQVELRDLAALHYLIPTVGNEKEEELFDHGLNAAIKSYSHADIESMDRAAGMVELLGELIIRHRTGELQEAAWHERVRARVDRWLHRADTPATLGGMLDEARQLHADHATVRRMKEEVVAMVREAHERYHIPFEQRLTG